VTAKHDLTDAEKSRGQRGSALVRSAQKQAFLWEVRDHLIKLARSGTLGSTLRERADQLNELGVRTATGKLLDAQKLSAALQLLGADASKIKDLLLRAEKAAEIFGVEDSEMVDQLWHEWLYHHTIMLIEHRANFYKLEGKFEFKFEPRRPFEWNKDRPTIRDQKAKIWWWGRNKVMPQQAHLVYALFGMFEHHKISIGRQGSSGRVMFP